ncbi:MAG: hypothetical protein FD187_2923 [bacterium]|nr:MAG: hypothetical protein FD142_1452 [bacterium]KAF0147251.1 MAG: hypothetical protein FD187_2923 [bacterium]KAF0165702.1 MAG: hypothetical protein FD158_2799 [bacterium]TXT17780.1 MAG: hypothetical protein FD132_2309 [bacterium]
MHKTRLLAFCSLALLAQGASATTLWLKDNGGNVCRNSASTNPGQVIGLASVTSGGALTLTINNPANGTVTPNSAPCTNLPKAPANNPLVLSGNVTPRIVQVNMTKPGTNGALECLKQGNNFSGVSGAFDSGQGIVYTATWGFSYQDGCGANNNGQPAFSRTLMLRANGVERPVFSGSYHIFNEANPVPEPGSLALLVAGASGLLLLALRNRRLRGMRA